jgi:site-specific DNA-methyltransferase (adenine-specific)
MRGAADIPGELEGSVLGDNLDVLRSLPDSCIDLIYVDPPFGTGTRRHLDSIRTGSGTATRTGFGGRTYRWRTVSSHEYDDALDPDGYLAFLGCRLLEMHRVLTDHGSLYLHLDHHAVHRARLLCDDVFGAERFLNEIIWAYDFGGRSKDRWARKHDNILWYAKSPRWTFNPDQVDRLPYLAPGLVGPEKSARGKLLIQQSRRPGGRLLRGLRNDRGGGVASRPPLSHRGQQPRGGAHHRPAPGRARHPATAGSLRSWDE